MRNDLLEDADHGPLDQDATEQRFGHPETLPTALSDEISDGHGDLVDDTGTNVRPHRVAVQSWDADPDPRATTPDFSFGQPPYDGPPVGRTDLPRSDVPPEINWKYPPYQEKQPAGELSLNDLAALEAARRPAPDPSTELRTNGIRTEQFNRVPLSPESAQQPSTDHVSTEQLPVYVSPAKRRSRLSRFSRWRDRR